MKKIRRIAPPKKPKLIWDVKFRQCATGIAIDIGLADYFKPGSLFFTLHRVSYLIPWETIDAWSKRGEGDLLISVKPKKNK